MTGSFALDPTDPVHARALARLESETIGWLGTIGRDGYPHAVPVWFLWHDGAVLVFSQPRTAKVRNLRTDPHAFLHLEAGVDGEQLQVLQGIAELSPEPTSAWIERVGDAYLAKYAAGIAHLGWTPGKMYADYSTAIVLRPQKLIAW